MRDEISYFIALFGIESSTYIVLDIENDLSGVSVADFRIFAKENINHTDLQFKNGYQKFLTTLRLYKKTIRDEAEKKSENYSKILYEKIKAVFMKYQDMDANNRPELSDMRFGKFFDGGKPLFGDKDIEVIAKVWKFFGGENGFESLYKVWVLNNTQLIKVINESVTEKVELALQGRVQNLIESKRG